jgi:NADH:ubiquinone oxidoreductase subunit 6 (subunit J)
LVFNQNLFIYLSNYSLLDVISQITNFNKEIILYQADVLSNNFQQIDSIGFSLYVYGAIPLILCSIILLLAMFSAIIIPPTSLGEENIKSKEFNL